MSLQLVHSLFGVGVLHSSCPSSCLNLDAFSVLGETPLDELYLKGDLNTPLSIGFSFMISWEQGELHNLGGHKIFSIHHYFSLLVENCKLSPF